MELRELNFTFLGMEELSTGFRKEQRVDATQEREASNISVLKYSPTVEGRLARSNLL